MKTGLAVGMALAAALLSGCGTVLNLASGDPEVYGGVRGDLQAVQTPRATPLSNGGGKGAAVLVLALLPAELCLSFVGDTLTLPLTVYLRQSEAPAVAARPATPAPPALGISLGSPRPLDEAGPDAPLPPTCRPPGAVGPPRLPDGSP